MEHARFSDVDTSDEVCKQFNKVIDNLNQVEGKVCQMASEPEIVVVRIGNKCHAGLKTHTYEDGLFEVEFFDGEDGCFSQEDLAKNQLISNVPAQKGFIKMKLLIFLMLFVSLFVGVTHGAWLINYDNVSNPQSLVNLLRDRFANQTANTYTFVPGTEPVAAVRAEGMVYYDDSAKNLKLRTDSAWVDIDVAGATSLDAAYGIGQAITVDSGAVALTAPNSDDNVVLALDQQDTSNSVAALTVASAGDAAAIIIAQGGSGGDIQGTAGWSIDKVGVGTFISFILENSETIDNADNGEITFSDGVDDTAISWSGTTLEWTTDTSIDTVDWGDLDDHIGLRNITFDVDEKGTVTLAGTGTADDLTIQQTTSGQNASLILQSTGTGDDALSLISSVADISLVSASDITRTAASNITDVTTDGAYTLTIGGASNGKLIVTAADTASITSVDDMDIATSASSSVIDIDSAAGKVIIDGGQAIADAVTVQAPAGGVDITSAATFDIDITATGGTVQVIASEAAANQFKVDAQGVVVGFAIVLETTNGGIQFNADGANGNITIDAASVLTYVSPSLLINNDASTNTTGIGTGTTTGTVTLGGTGTQAIDVGAGAGIKTVTVGSTTTTSATTVQSGSGDLTLTSTDAITMTSAGVFGIGANAVQQDITIGNETGTSSLTLLAGTGDIDIQGVAASTITIGDAAQTAAITIGASTVTMTDLSLGTGVGAHTIHIGDGGVAAQVITIGSDSVASSLTLKAGTGNFVVDGVVATTYTIGNSSQTGTITIGESDATMILNLGTGVGAHTIHIGDGGTAAQVVTIGSTSDASAVTVQSGTGKVAISSTGTGADAITLTASNAAGGILFDSNNKDQKVITMRISAGVVTASEIMIDAPGAPYICTGLEAGISEAGTTEGKATCNDDADIILFSIQLPELMYDTDTIEDLVLEFDIDEVDIGGTVDVDVFQYGDLTAEISDVITIANASGRSWKGLTTLSSGIGAVANIDQGDVFLVRLSPADGTSDFDIWGVRLTYRVGIQNTD